MFRFILQTELLLLLLLPVGHAFAQYQESLDLKDVSAMRSYTQVNSEGSTSKLVMIYFRLMRMDTINQLAYLDSLDKKFHRNIYVKNGEVNVLVPPKLARRAFKYPQVNRQDNFDYIDMGILSFLGPIDFNNETKDLSEAERYLKKIDGFTKMLSDERVHNYGFFWRFLAPYFIEMREHELLEVFTYLLLAPRQEKAVVEWLANNESEVEKFVKWDEGYEW